MKSTKDEFLETLSNYQGILHKVGLIYFQSQADREDNFQEIVYQLWKSWPGLKNKKSVGSWIYAVSINTSISNLKRAKRVEISEELPELTEKEDTLESISDNERTQALLMAISKLNEIDRSVMLLYLEEKSYAEMSEILGISQSNVGVRINRAKQTLKKHLKHLSHGK